MATPTDLLAAYAKKLNPMLSPSNFKVYYSPSLPYHWSARKPIPRTSKVTLFYGGVISVEALEMFFPQALSDVSHLQRAEGGLIQIDRHRKELSS